MDRSIDLNRVAAFVRVVHHGSFTAAAKSLGLPKSSVSRSVAQLETDLGVKLLHRTTRQVRPTDAGGAFYERALVAISELGDAALEAADTHGEPRGVVRLTAPVDFGVAVLAPLVARFCRKHPKIHVDLVLTGRVVDLLGEGVDLALRAGQLRDSSLVARRIGPLTSGLFASPRYVTRRGAPSEVAALTAHDCVVFRPTAAKSAWSLEHTDGARTAVTVSGPISADDLAFVRKAVLLGAGVGLLPEFLCVRDEARGKLVRVLPGWRMHGTSLSVVHASSRFVPRRVAVLQAYLVEELTTFLRACARHAPPR